MPTTAAQDQAATDIRCDRCTARATFTLELDSGSLQFCEHHRRQCGLGG